MPLDVKKKCSCFRATLLTVLRTVVYHDEKMPNPASRQTYWKPSTIYVDLTSEVTDNSKLIL